MIKVIENTDLKNLEIIQHGFFTRHGGISKGYYASLNCAYACKDELGNVFENRRRVAQYFGYPIELLVTTKNVHGNNVVIIDQPSRKFLNVEADAMVTKQNRIMLGSDSADCPIVLFVDNEACIIGLAHAGWRSAKSGIIEATVDKMIRLGAKPYHITVAISPCINQNSYEIDHGFYQQFINENPINQKYFIESKKTNHFFFNLLSFKKRI